MKYCMSCGNKMDEKSDFCSKCGTKFDEIKVKKSKKNPILFISILLIIAGMIIGCLFIFGVLGEKKYKLDVYEALAYARLRVAEARSAYNGLGSMETDDFKLLGNMVKKYDSNSNWFSGYSNYYSRTADTDKYEVTYLCSEDYCAKFVVEDDDSGTKLIDYTFESSREKGYRIYIVNSSN